MEEQLNWNNFYKHPRFWRHIIVWAIFLIFIIAVTVLDYYYNPHKKSFYPELRDFFIFFLEFALLIYSTFYAYNKLITREKYVQLFSIIVLVIVIVSLIDSWLIGDTVQIGILKGFWANLIVFPMLLTIAFGIKLAYHGTRQLFIIQRLENKQRESELKLLKSQINPHFLFNTLNNIYATNLENHDKANDIILGLADLLRYQLESNKKQKTLLINEIKSLENYIVLEKIRVLDCEVHLEKQGNFDDVEIVPLLLLPFIENAFKYGTGIEPGSIDIRFEIDEKNYFSFYCGNKIVQKKGKVHSGGIGLDNVRKRLQLMYKNKHQLDIKNENNYFEVRLNIQL